MSTWPTQSQIDAYLLQWKVQMADLQQKIDAIELVRKIFDDSPLVESPARTLDVDIDAIRQCRTQREALREIAMQNGGIVRVKEAAPILIATGLSQAKLSSVTSTSYNQLNGNSEWEYVEPGTFRLVNFAPTEEEPTEHEMPAELLDEATLVPVNPYSIFHRDSYVAQILIA